MSKNKELVKADGEDRAKKRETVIKLTVLVILTAVVFAFYRISMEYALFEIVMPVYYISLTGIIAAYIVYNRGFAKKNITADMLPDEWSYEEKTEFIEDGKRRIKKSSWMLMIILAISFTLVFELLELYALPWLEELIP